ncbi:T9SS type A sorting domain-containing protein [Hymenobacter sp. J193]|uniref:T9SS type A sorting domain-containing protein n=1 Tax=Hymenobacter sp. J193 TaxID=2898429 RepID=UPI0021519819|nr:T9SS type A sorting domain-containing protein [Hymenobacter sp. J193]MCR5889142.1 T9SS type A sorting domain-containing protein [Hymenobacter sp. J193]
MKKLFLLFFLLRTATVLAQSPSVAKTNPQRVYMHYMPWFETPQTSDNRRWGLHWTMSNKNPNIIDPATGKRQIAAHYYPLIGPYASSDPNVIEYHLLLLKYAGVDGVLIDFYGNGGNDLPLLLRNTNALVPRTADVGLGFAVVFEDQFAATLADAKANMQYVGTNYFSRANYLQLDGKPLVLTFGPQKYQTPADWTQILGVLPTPPTFLPLWYESADAGANASGEFSWIYSDFLTGLTNFYKNRAPGLGVAGGVAYPGFDSFYAKGGWGGPTWVIPHNNGQTLKQTLDLATQYQSRLDFVQLATFNDFGEGTMLEPTQEFGFAALEQVQAFTGVAYTVAELKLVYQLYTLRKFHAGNTSAQATLDQAFQKFVALDVPAAASLLNSLGQPTPVRPASGSLRLQLYPNPAGSTLKLFYPAELKGGTVQVLDATGRIVITQPGHPSLDISGLASGTYRLVYSKGNTHLSQSFVK